MDQVIVAPPSSRVAVVAIAGITARRDVGRGSAQRSEGLFGQALGHCRLCGGAGSLAEADRHSSDLQGGELMSSVWGAGQPVIVGVDGSKSALDAVRWAVREAELRGVTLRLVHAFGWMSVADPDDYPELELGYRKALLTEAQEWLADAARLVPPGIEVVSEVLDDFPIPRLVTESRNAQLLVIGDRGLGGLGGLLVGSVAVALAVHAECPVVVVRSREPDGAPVADGPVVVGVDGSPVSEDALGFAFDAAAARRVPLVAVHTYRMTFFEPVGASMVD